MPLITTRSAASARALCGDKGATASEYTYSSYSESDLTTYNFTSVDLGSVSRPRHIIVALNYQSVGAHRTVSAFTVGGVSGSPLVSASRSGGGAEIDLHIYIFPGASLGASGTVSATMSDGCARCGVFVWAVYNLFSTTAFDTATATGASPHSLDVDVAAGGAVFGASSSFSAPTISWTGLVEDDQATTGGGDDLSGASISGAAAASTLSITSTISAGSPLSAVVSLR